MQPITSYSTTEERLRLILQAPPGAGKTTLACQFPKAYVLDCDINLGGAIRWIKANNKVLPVGFDIVDRTEDGKEVPENLRYTRLCACLKAAVANPDIETIVLDGATKISDYIIADILRQQSKTKMDIQMWGFYFSGWKQLIAQLSAQRKHLVLICHEKVEKDEVDQTLKYFLMIPGQFGQIAGSMFTDVWRCEVAVVGSNATAKYSWNVRTMPDFRFQLKNSFGLPPVFQFDWNLIQTKLDAPNNTDSSN